MYTLTPKFLILFTVSWIIGFCLNIHKISNPNSILNSVTIGTSISILKVHKQFHVLFLTTPTWCTCILNAKYLLQVCRCHFQQTHSDGRSVLYLVKIPGFCMMLGGSTDGYKTSAFGFLRINCQCPSFMWTEWKWNWSNRTIQNPVKSYQVFLPSVRGLPHVTTMVVLTTVMVHMPWTVNLLEGNEVSNFSGGNDILEGDMPGEIHEMGSLSLSLSLTYFFHSKHVSHVKWKFSEVQNGSNPIKEMAALALTFIWYFRFFCSFGTPPDGSNTVEILDQPNMMSEQQSASPPAEAASKWMSVFKVHIAFKNLISFAKVLIIWWWICHDCPLQICSLT